jgi:hypothetical protein
MGKREGVARLEFPPKWWEHSAWQRVVWEDTGNLALPRFIWLNAGRGAGKDIVSIRCILRDALKLYGQKKKLRAEGKLRVVLNPLVKIWVVAPAEDNITQVWEDWKGELTQLAEEWGRVGGYEEGSHDWLWWETVRERKLTLFGDGEIVIQKRLSQTKNGLRGPGVDLVHWTEFATETARGEIARSFGEELPGTVMRAGRLGRVYLTTTPKGPMGAYWEELVKRFGGEGFASVENGKLVSEDGLNYFYHVDAFQNEFLSEEQLVAIRAEGVNGWRFEQERGAKFVIGDLGGKPVFAREWLAKCLVGVRHKSEVPAEARRRGEGGAGAEPGGSRRGFRRWKCGVDIARLGDDETCYAVVDEDSGELGRLEFHDGLTGSRIVEDLVRLHGEFPGVRFKVDSTGHRGYIADFAPSWLPIEETQFSREKEKWVGGVRMLMQMGKLRIPDPDRCEGLSGEEKGALRKLLKQVLAFQEVVSQSGGITYSHPPGEHDDGVDGLMLAVMDMATALQGTLGVEGTRKALGRLNV